MERRDGSMTAWKDEDMGEERLNDTGTEFKQRSAGRGHCQDEGEQLIFVCECLCASQMNGLWVCIHKRWGFISRNIFIISSNGVTFCILMVNFTRS